LWCCVSQAIRQQLSSAQQENQQVVGQLASLKQQLAAAQAAAAQATGGGSASAAAAEKALGEATKRAERLAAQVGSNLWFRVEIFFHVFRKGIESFVQI
jgi:hypothetical protein